MYAIPEYKNTSLFAIILGIPLAMIHAFFEETYWRGLFVYQFKNVVKWSVVIPSLLFALWHIAPQFSITDNDWLVFVISTFPLGLLYGMVAYKTGSAKWSAFLHGVSGMLSYSGFLSKSLEEMVKKIG